MNNHAKEEIKWLMILLVAILTLALIGIACYFLTKSNNHGDIWSFFNEGQIIEVQKRIGEENKYEDYKVIDNNDHVQKIKEMLDNAKWEKAKMEMAHPPDYQFVFRFKNPKIDAKAVLYRIWLGPNNNRVNVVKGIGEYVHLDGDYSSVFLRFITGE
ncbi:hypothetical protein GCM10008967_30510 [Bacillus carboniphilus]|uniref:YhfM-like domain-containing protein n=1 Tax=Bacillus carboniphilus TaxID=86663 RepID=A0ABN0WHP5_9BACI